MCEFAAAGTKRRHSKRALAHAMRVYTHCGTCLSPTTRVFDNNLEITGTSRRPLTIGGGSARDQPVLVGTLVADISERTDERTRVAEPGQQ